ncbi:MAG: OmpH family outer membrane protein [Tepidisphaerales bacterium]
MKRAVTMVLVACAAVAVGVGFGSRLVAQPAPVMGPARIAIANPARIFNDMAETQDLKQRLEQERVRLEETERQKRQAIQALQERRALLRPDSPQFADVNRELAQAAIEFEVWGRLTQADIQRNQREQMRRLFDKIQAATARVAAERGFDLVLADQRPDIPESLEQLTVDQLRALINQRNVLFATPSVDISGEVTALLDREYRR